MAALLARFNSRSGRGSSPRFYGQGISSTDLPPSPTSASHEDGEGASDVSAAAARAGWGQSLSGSARDAGAFSTSTISLSASNPATTTGKRSERSTNRQHPLAASQHTAQSRSPLPSTPASRYDEFGAYDDTETTSAQTERPALMPSGMAVANNTTTRRHVAPVPRATGRMHKTLPAMPGMPDSTAHLPPSQSTTQQLGGSSVQPQPPVYGYTPIGWDKQMDAPKVADLVLICGEQIRSRGW